MVAIVAVAGATEAGSFDDNEALAALAEEYGTWLHVDAAWGGGLIFCARGKELMKGIASADSVTIDGHKQLFTPMGCGMVLYGDPFAHRHIAKTAEYIIRPDSHDLGRFTLEGSRPAMAYFLHMNFHTFGAEGLARLMEKKLEVTAELARSIEADPDFELVVQPMSDIVLFIFVPPSLRLDANAADRESRIDELQAILHGKHKMRGATFVSRTAIFDPTAGRQRRVLRAVINVHAAAEKIPVLLDDLRSAGMEAEGENVEPLDPPKI